MSLQPNSNTPTHVLEQQAAEQRRRLHNTVSELRDQVRGEIREKLDVKKRAREYVWPAAGTAFLFSLLFGYGTAGTIKHMVK
jgi:hypothetical protein